MALYFANFAILCFSTLSASDGARIVGASAFPLMVVVLRTAGSLLFGIVLLSSEFLVFVPLFLLCDFGFSVLPFSSTVTSLGLIAIERCLSYNGFQSLTCAPSFTLRRISRYAGLSGSSSGIFATNASVLA